MATIRFYCRNKNCGKETDHKIIAFNEENPHHNFAKISCIHCDENPFIVEYDKQCRAPSSASKRVSETLPNPEE